MRNIRFLSCLLGMASLLFVPAGIASAQTVLKIGYINSAAIYEDAPGARAAQTQFEQEMAGYRSEVIRRLRQ